MNTNRAFVGICDTCTGDADMSYSRISTPLYRQIVRLSLKILWVDDKHIHFYRQVKVKRLRDEVQLHDRE